MIRVLAATVAAMCGVAHACGNPGDKLANGAHYTIAFKTAPAPIKTSEHFAIDLTVCPLGKAPMPRTVRIDASMPEHRHGMNYSRRSSRRGPAAIARKGCCST